MRSLLLASRQAAAPGDTLLLGLLLEPAPGWHLYWRGLNDSGLPPLPSLELPPGAKLLEDWQWPAPERLVSPGRILDHVYKRRLLLTSTLYLAPGEPPAGGYSVGGKVDWVACREACRFGSDSLRLHLPVREAGELPAPSAAAKRIAAVRAALPVPLASGEQGLSLSRGEGRVQITMTGASELAFYPDRDCAGLDNPYRDAVANGDRLDIRLAAGVLGSARLQGILAVLAMGERRHYLLDLPLNAVPSASRAEEPSPTKE